MSKKGGSRFDGLFGAAKGKEGAIVPETSESLDVQASKSKNPDYQRTTVYLPKTIHRKLRAAAMEEGREMSDVIEDLVKQWLESRADV